MYPFPVKRYRDHQGWIPESDIDGIDAKDVYVSDCENIDFNNGFISNASAPIEQAIPMDVALAINVDGYSLLSTKFFTHTGRGNCELYTLYKYETLQHKLRFFIRDKDNTTEIRIDEQSNDVTIDNKPINIVYGLVDNQLKIDLNVTGTYNGLKVAKTVYLNLTLSYLDAVDYNSIATRSAGWYLFPRWLYWSHTDGNVTASTITTPTVLDMEGALDHGKVSETIYTSDCSIDTTSKLGGTDSCNMHSYRATVDGSITNATYRISIVKVLTKLEFDYIAYDGDSTIHISFWKTGDSSPFAWKDIDPIEVGVQSSVSIDSSFIQNADYLIINHVYHHYDTSAFDLYLYIDNITLTYSSDLKYVVIARGFDQQRGMLESRVGLLNENLIFQILPAEIDWRVEAYELYIEDSGIYKKRLEFTVKDTAWYDLLGLDGKHYIAYSPTSTDWIDITAPGVETLNTNYGLGYDVWAYNHKESIYGFIIYKEVEFRGRNYLARFDENLYYSHLAGSGLIQSDSFPYNDNGAIEYIVVSNSDLVKGVAITSLNELAALTNRRAYLYLISSSSTGIFYRKIRTINGSFGLGSSHTLVTALDGKPQDIPLFWINKWGAHIYNGGIQPPTDITRAMFFNYWRAVSETTKANAIALYNPQRREFWIQLDDIILIYEIMTKTFRKYRFPFKIIEIAGIKDNYVYIVGDDNKIYKIDSNSDTKLDAYIVSHYSTDTVVIGQYPVSAWEYQHKILQDIYIAFKDNNVGYANYTVIADGHTVSPASIGFNAKFNVEVLPSPLLIRYGKVKIKIDIPAQTIQVKEYGYSFSVPSQGQGNRGANIKTLTGIGQSSGLGLGVHL